MRLRALAVVAFLAAGGACQTRAASAQPPPTAEQDAMRRIWQSVYYPVFDSVTRSAGLSRMRTTALPRGQREIRIWIGGGLGYPQDLFRFVDSHGRVSGELVRYWHARGLGPDERPGETFHDLMLYSQSGRCSGFAVRAAIGTCRGEFVSSPDWQAVLRRAEAEGLWTLPDESSLPHDSMMVFDGWGITVELRDASRYRTYHYDNPDAHKWPEAAKAVQIARALDTVRALLRPADVVRTYRGVTPGIYRSEFVDCATGERWQFSDDLRSLAERSKGAFAPAADSGARYLVEVVGELTPEWLARRWASPYPRVLQLSRLVSVQPSPPSPC